ncbi:BrnT family toxin [Desulfonatronum parangueonense]
MRGDPDKSDRCYEQRGFDFAYVLRAFLDSRRVVRKYLRWNYGEERYHLLGKIEGRVFFVAFTFRGKAIRIISARKANQREVKTYEDSSRDN